MNKPFDPTAQFEGEQGKGLAQRDLDDLSREISGSSHKINRFFAEGSGPADRAEEKRKREFQRTMTALALRLLDPEYRAAFDAANTAIDNAQTALDAAMAENAKTFEDLESRAVKLPDGRRVYLREDGRGETADGELISADVMRTLDIPEEAATIEELNEARARRRQLGDYGDDIDAARTKVNDPNNPASADDLDKIKKDFGTMTREISQTANPTASFNVVSPPADAAASLEFDMGEIVLPPPG